MITPKEKEVLDLIADGFSTKEIADKLRISFYTVQTHRRNLLTKMSARNSTDLVVKFYRVPVN
jgi:DNA-binding NarL/FixJ family response regulator